MDTGDYIVIVNAGESALLVTKRTAKFIGATLDIPVVLDADVATVRAEHPERLIESAVRGMLPKNPLGRAMFRKLKVYAGDDHPHAAQQPQVLEL